MALSTLLDTVRQTTSTTGTGTLTLATTAVSGFQTFSQATGNANATVSYVLYAANGDIEIGQGTYTHHVSTPTLTRDASARKIESGTPGTGALTLSGTTIVVATLRATDLNDRSPVGPQTLYVPASAMVPDETAPPEEVILETTTNKRLVYGYAFDGAGSTAEYLQFSAVMPKSWNNGGIKYRPYWYAVGSTTNGVVWALEATSIADNESLDASWGTAVNVTDAGQSAADELYIGAQSGDVTVAGAANTELVFFRIGRLPGNGSDTYTGDAILIGLDIVYTLEAATDA